MTRDGLFARMREGDELFISCGAQRMFGALIMADATWISTQDFLDRDALRRIMDVNGIDYVTSPRLRSTGPMINIQAKTFTCPESLMGSPESREYFRLTDAEYDSLAYRQSHNFTRPDYQCVAVVVKETGRLLSGAIISTRDLLAAYEHHRKPRQFAGQDGTVEKIHWTWLTERLSYSPTLRIIESWTRNVEHIERVKDRQTGAVALVRTGMSRVQYRYGRAATSNEVIRL